MRMIPFSAGAPSISGTPFTIIDFPGTEIVVWCSQDRARGDTLLEDAAEVRRTRRKFADLADHALSEEETIRRIEDIEKEIR